MQYKILNGNEIFETATGLTVKISKDEKTAKDDVKTFNLGKVGFEGFTPAYLLQSAS